MKQVRGRTLSSFLGVAGTTCSPWSRSDNRFGLLYPSPIPKLGHQENPSCGFAARTSECPGHRSGYRSGTLRRIRKGDRDGELSRVRGADCKDQKR